ncbi:MAG TPA: DnaJ domain-containing protein [Pyrinomonadaceae bacterium]|nr:DnaJ domain-containing protein [Pyrinomonadaceae bacterium]
MNGKLSDQPLAELIREIGSKLLSGALRLERELARTVVYFEKGRVVFAASNIRTLRLREYMKRKELISEPEFNELKNPGADMSLALSLRDRGKLSQKDFDSLVINLVADVLRVPLLWTDGVWEFDERARLNDPVRVNLNPSGLLKEAAQRLPLAFVSLRFRNPSESIARSTSASAANNFLPGESFILSRLDKPTKLEELVAVSGLKELDAYRAIYGLALGGFVEREYWQNAFRTGKAKTGAAPPPSSSGETTTEAKTELVDHWAPVRETSSEDNLGEFLERLRAARNHYEVLDVAWNAGINEIKESYYSLARRYHPDRFHLKSGTRLHEQISSAFARITQAYETLVDANARAAYDVTAERSRQFEESAPKSPQPIAGDDLLEFDPTEPGSGQAEQYFREGFGALQQGQINAAINQLAAASRLNPQEARFRAYYGRALAGNEKSRRLAESEIQTAVRLEPGNVLYRTMLAELYFDLKFHRRAQAELDRALELNPNDANALRLLRKLKKLSKVGE